MNDKVIVLPNADEIIKRLNTVMNDEFGNRLYRIIAQKAGEEKVAAGVVMMFTLGIYDACQGYPPMMQGLMFNFIPMWIDVLIDDKEVAEAAKAFHQEAVEASRKK